MKIFFLFLLLLSSLIAKPTYTIAIVSDGDTEYSAALESALKTEIKQLLSSDYNVRFPKKLYKNGHWDYARIAANVNKSLRDRRSNMVITLGALSSHYISRKKRLPKPVIATAVIDPKMQRIPYKNGTSGKWNLTYVSANQTLNEDIDVITSLMPVKNVTVLIDAVLLRNTPEVGRYINKRFKKRGIKVTLVPIRKNNIEADLDKIPKKTDIVYVTPLFQLTAAQRKVMYEKLAIRELPTYAAAGQDDVELGALFANSPPTDTKRFIRQIALDVQQIALGSKASEQFVNFAPNPALSINMKTANDIHYTPSWDLMSRATIIQSEQSDSHYFNIGEIMDRAVEHNLNIIASNHKVELSQADLDKADSLYLPQIHVGAEATKVDQDRAVASLGSLNELSVDAYIKFSQQIWNQKLLANISVNENFLKAQQNATDYVKLDIGLAAAVNYLQIMQLRTKLAIEKNNLELSKTNMRSAITKRNIGIGNASDIYRWQTQIAGEKKSVLFTHSTIEQVKHNLNELLDLPQDLPLNFESIDRKNPVFMTHHEIMEKYFLDQTKFAQFEAFLVKTARENMPTLKQYDALEKARDLIVKSNNDAFYMPTVTVEGGVREHFLDPVNTFRENNAQLNSQLPPYADATDWKVGIFVRFPLYQGGQKDAALQASRSALLIAQAQKKALRNKVEKDVRNALYQAKASYLSIKLAQNASVSSKKNLALVKSVYAQGNIGIVDLLDAQNVALRAALVENNSRYEFMRDLLILQHNIGQVNFALGQDAWDNFYKALSTFNVEQEEDLEDDENSDDNLEEDDNMEDDK